MSDNRENIEEFVRKVVQQSEGQIAFNESHWESMETLLDQEMPVTASDPGAGYYHFGNVVSLLVGAVFLWVFFVGNPTSIQNPSTVSEVMSDGSDPKEAEVINSPTENRDTQDSVTTAGTANLSGSVERPSQSSPTSVESTTKPGDELVVKEQGQVDRTAIEEDTGADQKDNLNESLQAKTAEVQVAVPVDDPSNSEERLNSNRYISNEDQNTPVIKSTSISQTTENEISRETDQVEELIIVDEKDSQLLQSSEYEVPPRKGLQLVDDTPDLPDELNSVPVDDDKGVPIKPTYTDPVKEISQPFSRLAVGISVSPDFSSNKLFDYNRVGRDLGLVVDYWVNPRLSVSVGVFNTSKKYLVGGEEYSPPTGFWGKVTNGELPNTIDAHCRVLDIPVNVKYRILQRSRFSLLASLGASSYIMMKEDYRYELNGWESEWGTKGDNQHFFGVGNLQVHLEHRLGRSFAVEAAPFYKVPLTGYGHGNIKFHSMGALFTIRKYLLHR